MDGKSRAAGYYWITVYRMPESRQIAEWEPGMQRWLGCGWPITLPDDRVQVRSKRILVSHTPTV